MFSLWAELLGAYGVVVNAPVKNEMIEKLDQILDIPIVATVVSENDDIFGKIKAGARILNISGGKKTAELVLKIRKSLGIEFPIIATGGHSDEHISQTIEAGANAITYTLFSVFKIHQSPEVLIRSDYDVSALAAVASVRSPLRDERFPSEGNCAVAAFAR